MYTRTSEDGKSFPSMVGGTISWKILLKHIKTCEKTNYRKMVNMIKAKIKLQNGNLCHRFNRGILLLFSAIPSFETETSPDCWLPDSLTLPVVAARARSL